MLAGRGPTARQLREVRNRSADLQRDGTLGSSDLRKPEGVQSGRPGESTLRQLRDADADVRARLHLAHVGQLRGRGRLRAGDQASLRQLRREDLHAELHLGRLFWRGRLRPRLDQGGQLRRMLPPGLHELVPVAESVQLESGQSVQLRGGNQLQVLRLEQVAVL